MGFFVKDKAFKKEIYRNIIIYCGVMRSLEGVATQRGLERVR